MILNTRFITFYSYKGGVGRSMALANVAYKAVKEGLKVVVLDFDLEAPGISYMNEFREQIKGHLTDEHKKGGLFELICHYQKHLILISWHYQMSVWSILCQKDAFYRCHVRGYCVYA